MRRLLYLLAAVALVAVVVIGVGQAGREDGGEAAQTFDLERAKQQLAEAPPPLAALYGDANTIRASGFEAQLEDLRGHPVVINKWASWCRPCRAEFPIFQQVATERGKEVAFLGVNAADKRPAAEKFLRERPLPYPSFEDPDEEIARALKVSKFFPMTVFVDEQGNTAFTRAGEYASEAELEADIDKYLG